MKWVHWHGWTRNFFDPHPSARLGYVVIRNASTVLAIETVDQPTPAPSDTRVHRALLQLVQSIAPQPCDLNAERQAEEILLDSEVNGHRYLLVRMPSVKRPRIQLSPREQEIVRMVAKGHPNKVIADVLNISSWTVCTHLRRIFAKLGVGSRAAMVAQLLELGTIKYESGRAQREERKIS